MTLDTLDWETITPTQAQRLRGAARMRERAAALRFELGKITEAEFRAAGQLEEDLHVFALTGEKPDGA